MSKNKELMGAAWEAAMSLIDARLYPENRDDAAEAAMIVYKAAKAALSGEAADMAAFKAAAAAAAAEGERLAKCRCVPPRPEEVTAAESLIRRVNAL